MPRDVFGAAPLVLILTAVSAFPLPAPLQEWRFLPPARRRSLEIGKYSYNAFDFVEVTAADDKLALQGFSIRVEESSCQCEDALRGTGRCTIRAEMPAPGGLARHYRRDRHLG